MLEYGFENITDYVLVTQKRETNNPKNPTAEITDHYMTLDMAKEICMIQRSEIGRKVRRYFIAVEKQMNDKKAFDITLDAATWGAYSNRGAVSGGSNNPAGMSYCYNFERRNDADSGRLTFYYLGDACASFDDIDSFPSISDERSLFVLFGRGTASPYLVAFYDGRRADTFNLPAGFNESLYSLEVHGDYCVVRYGSSGSNANRTLFYKGKYLMHGTWYTGSYYYRFCGPFMYRMYRQNDENWVEVFEGEKLFDDRYALCSCCQPDTNFPGRLLVREYNKPSEFLVFDPEYGKMKFNSDFDRVA